MDADEVVGQVRALEEGAAAGAQKLAMAQALAQRARQLSRTASSLSAGVLELQTAMRALHDAKLLSKDEASVLPFIDQRISEILTHEGEVLARRGRVAPKRRTSRLVLPPAEPTSSAPASPSDAVPPSAPLLESPESAAAVVPCAPEGPG